MNIIDMDATKLFANVTLFFSGDETVNTDASCTAVIDTSPEVDVAIIYTPCVDVGAADVTAITLDPFSIVNVVLVLYVALFNVPVTFLSILLFNVETRLLTVPVAITPHRLQQEFLLQVRVLVQAECQDQPGDPK